MSENYYYLQEFFAKKYFTDVDIALTPIAIHDYDGTINDLKLQIWKAILNKEKFGDYEYVTHLPYILEGKEIILEVMNFSEAAEVHILYYGTTIIQAINTTQINHKSSTRIGSYFISIELARMIDSIFSENMKYSVSGENGIAAAGGGLAHPLLSINPFIILGGFACLSIITTFFLYMKRNN